MNKSILDTDIFSEISKAKGRHLLSRTNEYLAEYGVLTITLCTVVEVSKGFYKKQMHRQLDEFLHKLSLIEILNLTASSAQITGQIIAETERIGRPIGALDCMIAAIAMENGCAIVTGNVAHFQYIRDAGFDLKIENWRE